MSLALHPADTRRALATVSIVFLLVVSALMIRGGSPLLIGALIALILAPFALYMAMARPLIFPYGLYVLLIPFDNLLGAGSYGTLTKLVGAISACCLIAWCLRNRTAIGLPRTFVPLVAFLWWIGASTFWAMNQSDSIPMLSTFAGLALLYLAISIFPVSPGQYRFLVFAVLCAGVISAGYGALAFYHDPALSNQALLNRRLVLHIADIIIDPNHFSDALLFPASVAILLGLRSRRILAKLAYATSLGLITVAVMLSGSREGVVGLGVIALYFMWRSRHRLQMGFVALGALAVAATTQSSMWLRFSSALSTGGSGRAAVWAVGWEAFKHSPLTGYGIGNFTNVYDVYYLQVYQSYTNGWDSPAHNLVIRYLVETGIVGLALIAWFLWEQFRTIQFIDRKSPLYDYRIMTEAALTGLIVVAMSIDLFHYKYVWLVFAMVVQLRNVAIRSATEAAPPERLQFSSTYDRPSIPA